MTKKANDTKWRSPVPIALLLLVLCSSWTYAKPGFIKVVLEPNDHNGAGSSSEVLARLGAQPVKSYPAFTVIRVPEGRRDEVEGIAQGAGFRATLQEDWDLVFMPGAVVDTRDPHLPSSGLLSSYPGAEGLYVVQFGAPLDAELTEQIEKAGLRYVSYLPYNAVLVFGSQSAVARLAAGPGVQWSSLYHPAFRAQPADLATSDQVGRYVVQVVAVPESQTVIGQLLQASRSEGQVATYGSYTNVTVEVDPKLLRQVIEDPHVVGIQRAAEWMLSGEREAIAATASTPVTYEPYQDGIRPYKPAGDYKTWLSNRSGYLPGLLSDQMIAIADTGLAGGSTYPMHQDLAGSTIYAKTYCGGTTWLDQVGHGTMVAGVAAGNPAIGSSPQDAIGSQLFHYGMGLAPGATLFAQRITSNADTYCGGLGINTWAPDAVTEKTNRGLHSVVQTHSHNDYTTTCQNGFWVQEADGAYTLESQQYDYQVRQLGLPITVSAGNICQFKTIANPSCPTPPGRPCPTMVLPPATAKNVLSVGASESYRPGMAGPCDHSPNAGCALPTGTERQAEDYFASSLKRIAYVSRRGTTDGRIKPDIVAPATMISSTIRKDPGGFKPYCKKPNPGLACDQGVNGLYSIDTGTSFAAPQAAGAMAVVNAYWEGGFLPALSPAALKAVLVGSSVSLKGGTDDLFNSIIGARPTAAQGFGRLNLAMALTASPSQGFLDESSWPSFTGAGQTASRTFTRQDPSKPTVVVLAWSDEPAAAGASTTLVRDLNLEVFMNDGCNIYVGNRLNSSTEYSLPGTTCGTKRAPDTKNNVEMVVIPPNAASSFTLWVTAATWGGTVPQKFAVYYYNAY
ncbi:MAG TPA: S8 family serine peptidase [Thermoanaerobaculia bacterium]|jgi:hypothetical protein|nr:S8 family serine peptidase [Thermoanaerobaculia bacterium]